MNLLLRRGITFVITVMLLSNLPAVANARAIFKNGNPQNASTARVVQLLEDSGYKYTKKSATVWTIDFTGKTLKSFKVILATQDDLLVTFVVVARKKDIQISSEFMMKLLNFNHQLDRVKIGIDEDGDLFVRSDINIRILDKTEFKDNIEQVAAATNEVYDGVKSYISSNPMPVAQ